MLKSFRIFSVYFTIFCVLSVLGLGCSRSDSASTQDRKQAPDFKTAVFYPKNQPPFHLSEVNASQPVLIVFWATWCDSCKEELPKLNKLVSAYQGKIAIVSINAQEEGAAVEKFLTQNRIDFPVLLDPEGKFSDLFEVTAIPAVLLLAKGGKILYYGFRLPDKEKLEAALNV